MAFTVTLESVSRAGDPTYFDLGVLYLNDAEPDWKVQKTLRVTIDPALSPANQRAALLAQVTADADRYRKQSTIQAALTQLIGSTVTLP